MKHFFFFLITVTFYSCSTTTTNYYIVRHAEKATVDSTIKSSDVPLSAQGLIRAESLADKLKDKSIKHIFSTNTVRTKTTAEPLRKLLGVPVEIYNGADTGFVQRLKNSNGSVLIVGHSNTVDDLVNGLLGKTVLRDLPESDFGDLFIVHRKKNNFSYEKEKF